MIVKKSDDPDYPYWIDWLDCEKQVTHVRFVDAHRKLDWKLALKGGRGVYLRTEEDAIKMLTEIGMFP